MTKQEEVRAEIYHILESYYPGNDYALGEATTEILVYLHSQGVVLKVEGELPENPYDDCELWDAEYLIYKRKTGGLIDESGQKEGQYAYWCSQVDMDEAGYVKTEPLIETPTRNDESNERGL